MPILLKLLQKISSEETLSSSFHEANITLIPKSDKNITKKEKAMSLLKKKGLAIARLFLYKLISVYFRLLTVY